MDWLFYFDDILNTEPVRVVCVRYSRTAEMRGKSRVIGNVVTM
jgi:hypothetical protein